MTIKQPEPRQIPDLQQLWQEAFGDSEEFLDGFFATGFSPTRCRCLVAQDRPVAALYWFDCDFEDRRLAYIYAVATDKAYRGRGLCRQLMTQVHRQLKDLGYSAAVLVPGSEKLFSMYEKLGYHPFCPRQLQTVAAAGPVPAVTRLTAEEYFARRPGFLPEQGISQASVGAFLATFADFYGGADFITCLSREGDTLYFQEFLGDPAQLPGLLTALGAESAQVPLPGTRPYAMYLPFDGTDLKSAYLGLALN